jgi:hypothetical protein
MANGTSHKIEFNEEDFKYFKKECRWWLNRLSLGDWEVDIVLEGTGDDDVLGATKANYEGKSAMIYLAPVVESDEVLAKSKEEHLRMTARHEVLEVLLMTVQMMAQRREWDSENFNSEIHSVIHRLEKAFDECDRDVLREALRIKSERRGKNHL